MKKSEMLFILLLFIFTSCDTIKQTMDSWLGHTKAELYQSWGAPTYTNSDALGGEILTYAKNRTLSNQLYGGHVLYNNYEQYTDFYVNADGVIYRYRYGKR